MRDFSKSLIRFSWALSVFGAQQAANLANPRQGLRDAAAAMDEISHAAAASLGETTGGLYRAGDQLQNGMIDATWDLMTGSWNDPGSAMRKAWEAIDQSWSTAREAAGGK